MKKTSAILKTVAAGVTTLLGLIATILGIAKEPFYFWGEYTYYESYGGDAYTGIQNAVADTSLNIYEIGYELENAINLSFIICGLIAVGIGMYLLGNAILGFLSEASTQNVLHIAETEAPAIDEAEVARISAVVEKYKSLFELGAISEEEFNIKRKEILGL